MSNLSAYLHVPFCRRKCNYCDFFSAPPTSEAVSSYVNALCSQIRASSCRGEALRTVYVGGGTPSLLSEDDFTALVAALLDTFDLTSCVEFTVECNPESVTESWAKRLYSLGVNRISMGVQTFSDAALRRLGRLHTAAEAEKAFRILRDAGFSNISMDLMAALPEQDLSALESDLDRMISLSPEHISVYLLKIEPNTPFGLTGVTEQDEETQRKMYLLTHQKLTEAGYEHYEISNFAKQGRRAVHNCVYWTGGEYLAFGPGASGFRDGVRYRIPENTAEFCRLNGLVSPFVEERVDAYAQKAEAIFLGLRMSDGIPLAWIDCKKMPFLQRLCEEGLGVLADQRFSLTAEGFLVSDGIVSALMPDK